MLFIRSDEIDSTGYPTVTYMLANCPGYNFAIVSTRAGLIITGTTPPFNDWTAVQQVLQWGQYQVQSLKERGHPIKQDDLNRGGLW